MFQDMQSEKNTKNQKIAEITLTATKIRYFAWIQHRPNIGLNIVHSITNVFALALKKQKSN